MKELKMTNDTRDEMLDKLIAQIKATDTKSMTYAYTLTQEQINYLIDNGCELKKVTIEGMILSYLIKYVG